MCKKICLIIIIFYFLITIPSAYAMHCGKHIVHVGNHKYEVMSRCGPPMIREKIGISHKKVGEWKIIEEWLYVITKYGHKQMYLIRFDGEGFVRQIKWLGETK